MNPMRPSHLLLAALLCTLALAGRADPGAPDAARLRTRFGTPTSSVWRYGATFQRHDLTPVRNNNPHPEPQPHRDRPTRVALSADGARAYVTLQGTEADPGDELAVVDLRAGVVSKRITVGSRPYVPVLHPGGRFLVVTNELSNYATVIDTRTDSVAGEIPLDYYAQGLAFSARGDRAWVAIRYLDQVLTLDVRETGDTLDARVRVVGGFDEDAFFGRSSDAADQRLAQDLRARGFDDEAIAEALGGGQGGINAILRGRCGTCHQQPAGGFVAGPDPVENLLSAVEASVAGDPWASPLIRSVTPRRIGGFGDERRTPEYHSGGALFDPGDPELARLVAWIRDAAEGPGVRVGNPGSHPKDVALSPDGRYLFVGNTGTMDVSIVDVEAGHEVGAVYLQNVASHVAIAPDPARAGRDQLLALTFGAGFGAAKARDPHGAETWDRDHPAAQFAVLRDPRTTDPLPLDEQPTLGPFDAVDGTWNSRMKDIQNDLVAVDLLRLQPPAWSPDLAMGELDYLVDASAYESQPGWVRYTSDSAEATTGDVKGDLPPELQRVPGAFPEWAAVVGDRVFITMAGTFELVEWRVHHDARDPADRLEPVRIYDTGLRPVGVAADARRVVVANQLDETISIFDRTTGARRDVVVGDLQRPALDTDAEKGELVAHTSWFASDGDASCLHCHYRDTGDGRGWGAAETIGQDRHGHITPGGTLGIPQMRNVYAIQPYYFEGTHRLSEGQGADINEPASAFDFDRPVWTGDFTSITSPIPADERRPLHLEMKEAFTTTLPGPELYDLEERRNTFLRRQSLRAFGEAHGLKDLYRYVADFLGHQTHLLPNPFDQEHPAVARGRHLFNDARVMCAVCHTPPEFTNKRLELTNNERRALPPLTTITRRDASYSLASVRAVEVANELDDIDLDPDDRGRFEDVEGSFTTMQLRGLFDRPPVFLHHGRARSLREVLCTPDHPALGRYRYPVRLGPETARPDRRELGLNETTSRQPSGALDPRDQIPDTHGGTSHLTPRQIADLTAFLLSIE